MLACALHEGFVDPTGDRKSSACKLNWMTYTAWTSPLHLYYTSPNTLHIVSSVTVLIRLSQPSWRRVLVEAGAGIRSRRRGTICHHAGAGGCVLELDGGECECAREHNVPWNTHRDAINQYSVQRFSSEKSLRLEQFYSIDEWDTSKSRNRGNNTKRLARFIADPQRNQGNLDLNIREFLWSLPPSMTENDAGVLTLCIGMPVLLKSNRDLRNKRGRSNSVLVGLLH